MTILLRFLFLFCVVFNVFTIIVVIENAKSKPALAIFKGAPITVVNDAIEILPCTADKTNVYQSSQKKQYIYKAFLLINSLSLISAIK